MADVEGDIQVALIAEGRQVGQSAEDAFSRLPGAVARVLERDARATATQIASSLV